jgi:hypothetical protein
MKWFGDFGMQFSTEMWTRIDAPKGETCFQCDEPILPNEPGVQFDDGDYAHRNCFLRGVIGSVAHVERRCGCYVPGSEESDPLNLTRREAANRAVEAWERQRKALLN